MNLQRVYKNRNPTSVANDFYLQLVFFLLYAIIVCVLFKMLVLNSSLFVCKPKACFNRHIFHLLKALKITLTDNQYYHSFKSIHGFCLANSHV